MNTKKAWMVLAIWAIERMALGALLFDNPMSMVEHAEPDLSVGYLRGPAAGSWFSAGGFTAATVDGRQVIQGQGRNNSGLSTGFLIPAGITNKNIEVTVVYKSELDFAISAWAVIGELNGAGVTDSTTFSTDWKSTAGQMKCRGDWSGVTEPLTIVDLFDGDAKHNADPAAKFSPSVLGILAPSKTWTTNTFMIRLGDGPNHTGALVNLTEISDLSAMGISLGLADKKAVLKEGIQIDHVSIAAVEAIDHIRVLPRVPKVSTKWAYRVMRATENPSGFGFGFWSNYWMAPQVVEVFGRRPYDRVDFHSWQLIEPEKGAYAFDEPGFFENSKKSHRCGSTIIASVNMGSANSYNAPGNHASWIPNYIPKDERTITNDHTRASAKDVLYRYVQKRLEWVGQTILLIDYEPMWNYDMATESTRKMFSDWFVEAAEVVRRAANDMNASDRLEVGLNLNGNPLKTPAIVGDSTTDSWLLNAVAAADVITIDTYGFDSTHPVSPDTTMSIWEFWIKNYSMGKPVMIAEVGMRSEVRRGYHANGTEWQQAEYFKNLFAEIAKENLPDGALNGQVRAFCFWGFRDDPVDPGFGFTRADGSHKPVVAVAQNHFEKLAEQRTTRPSDEVEESMYTTRTLATDITLDYVSGTDHQFLRLTGHLPVGAFDVTMYVETTQEGCALLSANVCHWIQKTDQLANSFDFDLSDVVRLGQGNVFDLYFTGDVFPFTQIVKQVKLNYRAHVK